MYEIEKGVPLPEPRGGSGTFAKKYDFGRMDIGDSFFVPCTGKPESKRTSILTNARLWSLKQKRGVWNFTSSVVDGGVRVWRTDDKPEVK